MLNNKQSQELGADAIGAQGGRDAIINVGLCVEEVRSVATMVIRDDFLRMLDTARDVAEARARKVLEEYLERIQREFPDALQYAKDPDAMYVLYAAQKAAARTDDADLHEVLVELLVDRSKQDQRSLTQLVLNEAIEVVPRITTSQINVLTLAVIFQRLTFSGVATFNMFLQSMDIFLSPFLDDLPNSPASINHLVYAGCGAMTTHKTLLADAIVSQYPGVFSFGTSEADVRIKGLSNHARGMLIPCEHNPAVVQVMAGTQKMFEEICTQKNINAADQNLLQTAFTGSPLPRPAVQEKCLTARPYFAKAFKAWDSSNLRTFVPSNIGLAIAHARLAQLGNIEPLCYWIE